MAKYELSNRENWQTQSGEMADIAEKYFKGTIYEISDHPTDLKHLYEHVKLSDSVLNQIYCPDESTMKIAQSRGWGVSPDFSIVNTKTGKTLFGEIKRQDGWVEGKDPSAGRGNAHERMCKLFTPGLIKAYRHFSGITSPEILPFWVVIEGDITRDPKRNREITFWFDTYDKNFYMWRPNNTNQDLINHFEKYLKKYLD